LIKISKFAALISKSTASPAIQQLHMVMAGTRKETAKLDLAEIMEDGRFKNEIKILILIFSDVKSLAGVGFRENVAPDGLIGKSFRPSLTKHLF
jgi:hypothetical protein